MDPTFWLQGLLLVLKKRRGETGRKKGRADRQIALSGLFLLLVNGFHVTGWIYKVHSGGIFFCIVPQVCLVLYRGHNIGLIPTPRLLKSKHYPKETPQREMKAKGTTMQSIQFQIQIDSRVPKTPRKRCTSRCALEWEAAVYTYRRRQFQE